MVSNSLSPVQPPVPVIFAMQRLAITATDASILGHRASHGIRNSNVPSNYLRPFAAISQLDCAGTKTRIPLLTVRLARYGEVRLITSRIVG